MGVWNGATLYFRESQGVEAWMGGAVTPFLPGVPWLEPMSSQDGTQIVFASIGSDALSYVSVVNIATRQTHELSTQPRNSPIFLSPRYVWYRGERLCTTSDSCPFSKTMLTGKTYIFDLLTGIEAESVIADIADVWPHGA
jgi:hypothetical protein